MPISGPRCRCFGAFSDIIRIPQQYNTMCLGLTSIQSVYIPPVWPLSFLLSVPDRAVDPFLKFFLVFFVFLLHINDNYKFSPRWSTSRLPFGPCWLGWLLLLHSLTGLFYPSALLEALCSHNVSGTSRMTMPLQDVM